MTRIVRHLRQVSRVAFGRINAGRGLTVFPDDVFLVSYPRSGSTWLRFLIGNLAYPADPVNFLNVDSRIPDIYLLPDRVLRRYPRPRILKSHEPFDPRYSKIIYIVRDPRDLVVSLYHYDLKRGDIDEDCPTDDFVRLFVSGSQTVVSWGPWGEHVLSWCSTRGKRKEFLLLRYEDMLTLLKKQLAQIASFLNLNDTEESLDRAVELSSAERMKNLENKQSREWAETKGTRQDKKFVRNARAGEWQSVLSQSSILAIETAWGPIMQNLGYELIVETAKRQAADKSERFGL